MSFHSALLALLTLLVLSLVEVPVAHAAGATEADVFGLFRHLLNLGILVGILTWFLRKPISDFLQHRRLEVKEALDESWEAKSQAEERYQEIEARISNFEGELEKLMTDVRADTEMERAVIEERAQQAASQLEAAAERTVSEELRRARRELRDEAIGLAVNMAGELLNSTVSTDDQQRLTEDYLGKVGETARG